MVVNNEKNDSKSYQTKNKKQDSSYHSSPNLLFRVTIMSCSATVMFLASTTSLFTSISVMVVMMSLLCFHE